MFLVGWYKVGGTCAEDGTWFQWWLPLGGTVGELNSNCAFEGACRILVNAVEFHSCATGASLVAYIAGCSLPFDF